MGDVANNGHSTGGVTGKGFKPGQSGNPTGRPKGVARQARDLIDNNPGELLEVFLQVAKDEKAKPSDRLQAASLYLDRAYGKAPAYAPVEGADPLDRTAVDAEIQSIVDDLEPRRQAKTARKASDAEVAGDGTDGR